MTDKTPRLTTTIRLPAELKEALQEQAQRMGTSLNERILTLIHKGIQREEAV